MRIDAHQHYWKLDRGDYDWPTPDLSILYKDYLPDDLEPHLTNSKIDKTILVQATPTLEETHFLLNIANKNRHIAGVVGWLDMTSPEFTKAFSELRLHEKFVGLRPMLQNLEDKWILRQRVKENIREIVDAQFQMDLLIMPKHLPHVIELLHEIPQLRAIIDHCAKPNIHGKQWDEWAKYIEETAQFDNVMCKLSGLVTEAHHLEWRADDFEPYIRHVIDVFGEDRIVFGSDWPVCLLAASYEEVVSILTTNLPDNYSVDALSKLFGENARNFYQLSTK